MNKAGGKTVNKVGTFSRYLLPMFLNETWSRFGKKTNKLANKN